MSNKKFCKLYYVVYETGSTGCFLYHSDIVEECLEMVDYYIVQLNENWQSREQVNKQIEIPYQFFVPQIDLLGNFYEIKSHKNQITNSILSYFKRDFSLYIIKIEKEFDFENLPRVGNYIFEELIDTIEYAVLYETSDTGCFLGKFRNYSEADLLFDKIVKDLSQTIKNQNIKDNFFKMYAAFQLPALCTECDRYKIAHHRNQILRPIMIWNTPDFCLYIVKTSNSFNINKLKRAQNHFFHGESKYFEGQINLIMN